MNGVQVPTENYDLGMIDLFPSVNKRFLIESSVENNYDRNFLSTNSSLYDGTVSDSFIEFEIPGADSEMIDLRSISVELKLRIRGPDGSDLNKENRVSVVDGFFHRIFQSHSVFMNGVQVEGTNHFGLLNNLKTYTTMKPSDVAGKGLNMLYRSPSSNIINKVVTENFGNETDDGEWINKYIRGTIHMMGPLNLDIGTSDTYLLDRVGLRIRLELARPSLVFLSPDEKQYSYRVDLCKLWCKKIVPIPAALVALNQSIENNNESIEYMIDRPILKTIVFPAGQRAITIDNPFNDIVPHKILIVQTTQAAANGQYTSNPNYFIDGGLSNLSIDINGNNLANIRATFPHECGQAFYQTLTSLGINNSSHLITRRNFSEGRTIFVFDTRPTEAEDVLNLEKKANVRITMSYATPSPQNNIIYIIGYTLGVIQINGARRVFPNYLQ